MKMVYQQDKEQLAGKLLYLNAVINRPCLRETFVDIKLRCTVVTHDSASCLRLRCITVKQYSLVLSCNHQLFEYLKQLRNCYLKKRY